MQTVRVWPPSLVRLLIKRCEHANTDTCCTIRHQRCFLKFRSEELEVNAWSINVMKRDRNWSYNWITRVQRSETHAGGWDLGAVVCVDNWPWRKTTSLV